MPAGHFGSGTDPYIATYHHHLLVLLLVVGTSIVFKKAQGSVVSNRNGMTFGRIVLQVNTLFQKVGLYENGRLVKNTIFVQSVFQVDVQLFYYRLQ